MTTTERLRPAQSEGTSKEKIATSQAKVEPQDEEDPFYPTLQEFRKKDNEVESLKRGLQRTLDRLNEGQYNHDKLMQSQ